MDILGAIVDKNARILIMVPDAKRDVNAVDIYVVIKTDVHIKVKICSDKTKNRVKTQTYLNLLCNFCHISSIYWHLDLYIYKTYHKNCRATEVLFITFWQWHLFDIVAQNQKQKIYPILNNLTSLRTSTSFKITTNIFQPTTSDYMNPLPDLRTDLKGKYIF